MGAAADARERVAADVRSAGGDVREAGAVHRVGAVGVSEGIRGRVSKVPGRDAGDAVRGDEGDRGGGAAQVEPAEVGVAPEEPDLVVNQGVELSVYHLPRHDYNVPRMLDAMAASLVRTQLRKAVARAEAILEHTSSR